MAGLGAILSPDLSHAGKSEIITRYYKKWRFINEKVIKIDEQDWTIHLLECTNVDDKIANFTIIRKSYTKHRFFGIKWNPDHNNSAEVFNKLSYEQVDPHRVSAGIYITYTSNEREKNLLGWLDETRRRRMEEINWKLPTGATDIVNLEFEYSGTHGSIFQGKSYWFNNKYHLKYVWTRYSHKDDKWTGMTITKVTGEARANVMNAFYNAEKEKRHTTMGKTSKISEGIVAVGAAAAALKMSGAITQENVGPYIACAVFSLMLIVGNAINEQFAVHTDVAAASATLLIYCETYYNEARDDDDTDDVPPLRG